MADRWSSVVQKAQGGDSAALLELLDEFENLILSAIRGFHVSNEERGDLLQESYVGLLKAVKKFDPTRGKPFAALVKTQTRAAVWQFIRVKRRTTSREIVYSRTVDHDGEKTVSFISQLVDPQAEDDFSDVEWRELLASLSEREALVVQSIIIDGYSMAELARVEGVHPDTVMTWKKRAFAKILAFTKRDRTN